MAGRANNLLASVFTPPPPKPKFAGISTRRVLFLHNRTCFSIATKATTIPRKIRFQIRRSSLTTPSSQDPVLEEDSSVCNLCVFQSTDLYFLKKLLNLKGDDGFRMNDVLVAEWYIMGLWPLVYSMLLLPTARTPKCSVPVWPFLVLSCIGGAYALFPFFILWKPPPPPVEETELRRWPLNFLESKLTAGILLALGLGLIVYAGISTGDWKEFYQYFRQSRFIHAMSIDFVLLSAFAPFWVFNDMTTRKWYNKGSWLLPVSAFPFLGPALYLLLRPPVPAVQASSSPSSLEEE
nr:Taste receptor type 1 member 1 like [Ipomoea batatas]